MLPRTDRAARSMSASLYLPSLIVPDGAVDAQSLVALADLVVSAGGTMNREAVALGTPGVHDLRRPAGRRRRGADPGGRLRPLTDPRGLELVKRDRRTDRHDAAIRSCSST